MKNVSTFDAKNRLSALIAAAVEGEPQLITKNGVETAVLISYQDYLRLTARAEPFVDFLLNSPLRNSGIDLERSKAGSGRETLEFD
ncbi:MAG: type II toxin-antitoxin system Phd/YefM family antitoxin [Acidobacteria bacterium]|nr:type II toxin-antitoxin system Phd/YefM family antitoxin [Acidobacteriota bacterium]MBK8151061.1 type II toxin-antitoxin system Phd/YefM family antitoxin [Acidobacteriota bacterium]MBK8809404.1 type II toxin-antitoxin system Phd/YefM family antitoxin [Acidobacteriota bacterium]